MRHSLLITAALVCIPSAFTLADQPAPRQQPHPSIVEWQQRQQVLDAMDTAALVRKLGGPTTPHQVEQTLVSRGEAAIPHLVTALQSSDSTLSDRAASILGQLRAEAVVSALIEYSQAREYKSEAAARALGKIGGPVAASHLLEALAQPSSRSNRAILPALSAIGDNRMIEPVAAVLATHQQDVPAKRQAVEALSRFSDPRARRALERAVDEDPNWYVYFDAKRALLKVGSSRPPFTVATDYHRELITKSRKMPVPPEGVAAFFENRARENRAREHHTNAQIVSADSFLPQAEIDKARQDLLGETRLGFGRADAIVEELMYRYMGNVKESKEFGIELIAQIGPAAIPALRNGVKRGDQYLARDCEACLRAVLAQPGNNDILAPVPPILPPTNN